MSQKPNTQASPNLSKANFAGRQAKLASQLGDKQASNLYLAIRLLLLYGRPEIQFALNGLNAYGFYALVRDQHTAGVDVGTAWWAIRRCMERKEQTDGQKARIVAFRDRRAACA